MKILCLSAYAKAIQDVGDFVSSVEHKRRGKEVLIRGKKWYKYCSVSCTDRLFHVLRPQCIVTSRRVNLVLSVYVFFSLKAVGPIDCHYITDRLQRFELKIFVCVLLKKQSHLHLGWPGGKQINIKFSIWVNYHFNISLHTQSTFLWGGGHSSLI